MLHHKAVQAMYKSHLLLLFSSNIEGVCSAKIFDYLASKRKILVTPDGENIGIVRKIINDANAGVILNNPKQIEQWLRKCYKEFLKTGKIESSTKLSEIEKYDRKKQVKMLSQILEKVIKRNSL